ELGGGFRDRLYTKIPLDVEQAQLDCAQLQKPIESDHLRFVISREIYFIGVEPQTFRLAQAGQWMTLNRNVQVCADVFKLFEKTPNPDFLSGWLEAVKRGRELHPNESEVMALVRRCEGDHLFFVIPKNAPTEIPKCGASEIPMCGSSVH